MGNSTPSQHPAGAASREARLLDEAPWATIELDDSLRVTAWSGRAAAMFGVARDDALGREIAALLPLAEGDGPWRALLSDAGGGPRPTRVQLASGALVVEWSWHVLRDDAGAATGLACYGRDITGDAARRERQALQEMLLRAIVENVDIVVWSVTPDGVCNYHEGRGLDSIGLPQGYFLGKNMFELYGPQAFTPVLAGEVHHSQATEGGFGAAWESWMIPARDERGEISGVVALSLNVSELKRGEQELRDKLALIEKQQQVIRELSTPIIEVWDHVLTLPIIGMVDSVRAAEIMDNLLQTVARSRARFAILDMTGVEVIDTSTASHLIGMVRAIGLLGAEGVLTGIHPNIAQTVVTLGLDLSRLTVRASLREALKHCIERMGAARGRR